MPHHRRLHSCWWLSAAATLLQATYKSSLMYDPADMADAIATDLCLCMKLSRGAEHAPASCLHVTWRHDFDMRYMP